VLGTLWPFPLDSWYSTTRRTRIGFCASATTASYAGRRVNIFTRLRPVLPMSRCRAPTSAFFSLRTNTERISTKSGRCNPYHQQMNWLHFGRNCTRNKGVRYDRKFESTSNRCCRVANGFHKFHSTYGTLRPQGWRSITHMQRRRHCMTARGL